MRCQVNDCTDLSTCIRLKHSKWAIQGWRIHKAYDFAVKTVVISRPDMAMSKECNRFGYVICLDCNF